MPMFCNKCCRDENDLSKRSNKFQLVNSSIEVIISQFYKHHFNIIHIYNLIVRGAGGGARGGALAAALEEGFLGSSFLSLLTMKRMPRISSTTPMMIRMIPIRKYRSTLSSIQYEVGMAHVAEALFLFNTHVRSLTPL